MNHLSKAALGMDYHNDHKMEGKVPSPATITFQRTTWGESQGVHLLNSPEFLLKISKEKGHLNQWLNQ